MSTGRNHTGPVSASITATSRPGTLPTGMAPALLRAIFSFRFRARSIGFSTRLRMMEAAYEPAQRLYVHHFVSKESTDSLGEAETQR